MTFDPRTRVSADSPAATGVVGCYWMFDPLGGNWFQLQVSRCWGASTAKCVSFYQYGQTGNPIRFSMDWAYMAALEEQRRLELGGSPTLAQLLANPPADIGSEPTAGWARLRKVGFAPVATWPDTTGFNAKELDLGGEQIAANYKNAALGQASIIAPPGPAFLAACDLALSPFADGKFGQSIQLSVASATSAYDNATGQTVLTASDFNGVEYDHSNIIVGKFPSDLLRGVMPSLPASITGNIYVDSNNWEDYAMDTMVPEITPAGVFTGKWINMPGCVLLDGTAMNAATDWMTLQEAT
jgi:hypothetical protein